jgi:small conductance mechanosensitive channel
MLNFLHLDWNQIGEMLLNKTVDMVWISLLFFVLYQVASRIVKKLFKNYSQRKWADSARILTFSRLTTSGIQYITIFLYIYTILGIIGIPVGNILAGAGIFGVALGFAGRDLVADIINGFFIIVEHQINVGDTIRFENLGIEGIVKMVGIRSITLISSDGATAFIPNRNIESLKNFSYGNRTVLLDVPVDLTDLSKVKSHILNVNAEYPQVKFLGIVNVEDKLFIRSSLTAPLSDLTALKMEILDRYYEK